MLNAGAKQSCAHVERREKDEGELGQSVNLAPESARVRVRRSIFFLCSTRPRTTFLDCGGHATPPPSSFAPSSNAQAPWRARADHGTVRTSERTRRAAGREGRRGRGATYCLRVAGKALAAKRAAGKVLCRSTSTGKYSFRTPRNFPGNILCPHIFPYKRTFRAPKY